VIYLVSVYSHADANVRQHRFDAACAAAAVLIRAGHIAFSLVVHGHPLTRHGLPGNWSFWEADARWHLERCDEVVVLMLDGWEESVCVQAEIAIAEKLEKFVWYRFPVRGTTPTLANGAQNQLTCAQM